MRQPQCKVFWSSRHFIIILHVGYLWLALLQLDTVPGNCWIFHRTFQMQSKMIIPTIPNCCKNCRNNSGSREGTASAGRKRHAVATWTGILVVRICGIFFSVGLQVLMFWFCQGVPRALCCACKNTLSPCQESPFWSFFFLQDFSRQRCAKRQSGQEKQKWMQQKVVGSTSQTFKGRLTLQVIFVWNEAPCIAATQKQSNNWKDIPFSQGYDDCAYDGCTDRCGNYDRCPKVESRVSLQPTGFVKVDDLI